MFSKETGFWNFFLKMRPGTHIPLRKIIIIIVIPPVSEGDGSHTLVAGGGTNIPHSQKRGLG